MIEATRANPAISGYCVHALTDGDWILGAAILDLWRNPKPYVYEMTKEANQPQIVSIRVLPRNMYAEKGGKIEIIGINELKSTKTTVTISIVDDEGEVTPSKKIDQDYVNGVSMLYDEILDTKTMRGSYAVKVTVQDASGKLLTSNEQSFDVFSQKQLNKPSLQVAVLDSGNRITSFLQKSGIPYVSFSDKTDKTIPVIVGKGKRGDKKFMARVDEVKEFVRQGGYAIFLEVNGTVLTWGAPNPKPKPKDPRDDWRKQVPRVLQDMDVDKLPFKANMYATTGNYISRNHIVTDHAVFKGLPVNVLMSGVYENVCPERSICRPAEGKYLAGVITYDQQKNMDITLRHYNGIGDVLWAADVLQVDRGKGKMLYSTLKISENLGTDPVADKILFNLIDWTAGQKSVQKQ
jgi:hypothetical protein